jgi:hypothetical protein
MIARKQDPAELAKNSSVTKAEARAERQAQLRARQGDASGSGDAEVRSPAVPLPEDALVTVTGGVESEVTGASSVGDGDVE